MTSPEEVKAEYASSLGDLKFNSKPLINVLTMLAEENAPNAEVIVEAIETHLSKVSTEVKLPVLYLIDCIVKNVGGTYTALFSKHIVPTFCGVFKAVDEKTRAEMFKLRQTWNDVFPPMKLYALDVQISLLDPAWPVTAKPPANSIHLNPKFLQKTTPSAVNNKGDTGPAPLLSGSAGTLDKETLLMQEKLIQKQKELLELQQKKLELEVLQTKVKLQEQFKHTGPHLPVRPPNILLKPEVAQQLVPSLKQKSGDNIALPKSNASNGSRIHPVNSALIAAGSKPIRDPRLLRQQLKSGDSNCDVELGQKTAILDNNKIVTNKSGVRKIRNDPRLIINKDIPPTPKHDTNKPNLLASHSSDKSQKAYRASPRSSTDTSSLKSSSSSSLDSPSKNKSDKLRSPVRHKKKDKSEVKKLTPKDQKSDKSDTSEISSTFKGVKGLSKNRNYVRRNLSSLSPEPPQDEDLRAFGPPEKQPRLQINSPSEQKSNADSTTEGDVDLRQAPAVIGRKRTSTDSPERSNAKKSKSEVLDRLFGNEDTDLRQLAINPDRSPAKANREIINVDSPVIDLEKINTEQSKPTTERPPTPPPPIISSNEITEKKETSKSDLDAVRAKLANATNRVKILSKSFHKKHLNKLEDLDLRGFKDPSNTDISHKIIISPEDEFSIRSGNLTKEQGDQLLKKIIMQMEFKKLKEAKKKDHEQSLNISLQPISDEELIDSDEDKKENATIEKQTIEQDHVPPVSDTDSIPFKDKDERLIVKHYHPKGDHNFPPYYPRDGRDMRRFPGPQNWRGIRGRRGQWDIGPRAPIRPWPPQGNWRNMPPNNMPPNNMPPNNMPPNNMVPNNMPPKSMPPNNMPPNFPHQREFPSMPDDEKIMGSPDISDQLTNGAVNLDEVKSINIDGVPKDIRFYEETAIAFINWDEPKEISFMDEGGRHVWFNDTDSCLLGFNQLYKDVMIGGNLHKVRLGAPSREIYIDYTPYECYFGSAGIRIDLNGVSVTVRLEGPPPQVKIGDKKRTDLVAGKINLFINAKIVVPVFLDAKLQKFMLEGETHTLKFVNALQTVLINDLSFEIEYGGLPKPIIISNKKHFIRFSVLPKGIKPGKVDIKDMETLEGVSPPHIDDNSQDSLPYIDPYEPIIGKTKKPVKESPDRSPNSYQNLIEQEKNLDLLSNAMSTIGPVPTTGGYKVENHPNEEPKNIQEVAPPPPVVLNINDLFQKLVASGFVMSLPKIEPVAQPKEEKPVVKTDPVQNTLDMLSLAKTKKNMCENLKPIIFDKPETLKVRQSTLYTFLYSGMQCSSCGMRFSPEASMQYSQHLDWHFRQNRKGKRNIRVAASRKWYYSLADWKNYEELEDLEEREKNYFDQQQQSEGTGEEAEEEIEVPSVPADPDSTDECCDVCRDKFDQFFNEEKEEWHLKNAIKVDDKTYHPVCYEDYQKSLLDQADDSKLEQTVDEEKPEEPAIPGFEIIIDDDDDDICQDDDPYEPGDIVSLESDESKAVEAEQDDDHKESEDDGDDDDVILNEVAPIKIVVDDDDEEYNPETPITENMTKVKKEKPDDGFVEVSGLVSLANGGQIKIKAEPVDPDEVTAMPEEQSSVDVEVVPMNVQEDNFAHTELVTSIDGNIELVSSAPPSVSTSGVSANKIKINISKPLPVIANKEKESAPDSGFPSETYIDPSEPFPPGEEPEPISLKPSLKGVNLKKLSPVQRGAELTGLCSIM